MAKQVDITYGNALFELALEEGKLDGLYDEALTLIQILKDNQELIKLLKGINCHVNLIPVNEIKERDFKADRKALAEFSDMLVKGGLNATVRRTLGTDINAACGQLRNEHR